MALSTDLLREPFLDVSVGPPDAKPEDMIKLPHSVRQLISSFEYIQIIDGKDGSVSRSTIIFAEAADSTGQVDPGLVLDLAFSKGKIIRFKDQSVVETGKATVEAAVEVEDALVAPRSTTEKIKDKKERLKVLEEKLKARKPKFILQERNVVEVTFGYRNKGTAVDVDKRTVRGTIQKITHKATDKGMPTTEVMILDLGAAEFDKLRPETGILFTKKFVKDILGSDAKGVPSGTLSPQEGGKPARIDDVFRAIAKRFVPNAKVRINLTAEDLKRAEDHKQRQRRWTSGESLHEFLKDLAESLYAHYFVTTDKKDNKTILNLVSRDIFDKEAKFHFIWKGGDEKGTGDERYKTMKGFTLSLFPLGGEGGSSQGVCSERKLLTGRGKDVAVVIAGEKKTETVVQSDAELRKNTNASGQVKYTESCDDGDHEAVSRQLAGRMERALRLDFETVGIPELSPGAVEVSNVGLRYSGMFYAIQVSHKISAKGGYICKVTAVGNAISSGGVTTNTSPVKRKQRQDKKFRIAGGPVGEVPTRTDPSEDK